MYTGYLTENKLGILLEDLEQKVEREYVLPGTKKRVDFYLPQHKIAIEFDGPRHYTTSSTIFSDLDKRVVCREMGVKVVSIPYFLQPTKNFMSRNFPQEIWERYTPDPEYPQGFIDTKVLPYDFNAHGIARFENWLDYMGREWRNQVFKSLEGKRLRGLPLSTLETYFPHEVGAESIL